MSEVIRTLIVDDEPRARRSVQLLLGSVEGICIVGEAGSGDEAVEKVRSLHPDLMFLDVQMPGMDGFEALARLRPEEMPVVIFVTAFDEYALRAFEVHAIDYVLKPLEDDRFLDAVKRARRHIRASRAEWIQTRLTQLLDSLRPGAASQVTQGLSSTSGEPRPPPVPAAGAAAAPTGGSPASSPAPGDRIVLKDGSDIILLRPEEIDWIEADGDYMLFHVGPKAYMHRETMASLEARLDPARFRRIHRSTIVNVDRLVRLMPSSGGEHQVMLKDGTKLRLSKGYQDRMQEWLRDVL